MLRADNIDEQYKYIATGYTAERSEHVTWSQLLVQQAANSHAARSTWIQIAQISLKFKKMQTRQMLHEYYQTDDVKQVDKSI